MIMINILENEDIITENCYIRPLQICYDSGISDTIYFESCHGGTPINRMTWVEVTRQCPAWIGRKVKEYNSIVFNSDFCIGDLPNYLITPLTKTEYNNHYYSKYKKNTTLPFVKKFGLVGKTLDQIEKKDIGYFSWLEEKGLIIPLNDMYDRYLENMKHGNVCK